MCTTTHNFTLCHSIDVLGGRGFAKARVEIYRRTIEIPQCAHVFEVHCCLKVHNVNLKVTLPIHWNGL